MPYQNMSLEQFAIHVGMDARQVRKLADRGHLPGQKVAGDWRFNRAKVTEWLQQEMPNLSEARLVEIEHAMRTGEDEERTLIVTDLMGPDGIDLQLPARTRNSLLRELIRLVGRTGLLWDEQGLFRAVGKRESMCSTALPNGVAVPHPRQPMPYATADPVICLARVPAGIGFGSPDRGLTDLFFLLCTHDDRYHLRVLARLMRMLDEQTLDALRSVESPGDALETLIQAERDVVARLKK
ncbi:MAG: PTS transporter subunit EIIA [bacterium]|nr:PTS transporter subunit EIIA [bacterium]